jgi:hypothetical protein
MLKRLAKNSMMQVLVTLCIVFRNISSDLNLAGLIIWLINEWNIGDVIVL